MITAIHHQITKLRHNAILEIAKDSYLNELVSMEEAPQTEEKPAEKTDTTNPPKPTTK